MGRLKYWKYCEALIFHPKDSSALFKTNRILMANSKELDAVVGVGIPENRSVLPARSLHESMNV